MVGLIVSQVMLLAAAALIGFGFGWYLYTVLAANRRRTEEADIEELRAALTEAQVRRAQGL